MLKCGNNYECTIEIPSSSIEPDCIQMSNKPVSCYQHTSQEVPSHSTIASTHAEHDPDDNMPLHLS